LTKSGGRVKKVFLKTEVLSWKTITTDLLMVIPWEGLRKKRTDRSIIIRKGRTEG
jgi:hypothetical protein